MLSADQFGEQNFEGKRSSNVLQKSDMSLWRLRHVNKVQATVETSMRRLAVGVLKELGSETLHDFSPWFRRCLRRLRRSMDQSPMRAPPRARSTWMSVVGQQRLWRPLVPQVCSTSDS
jgi:hypothetical protein